MVADGPLAIAVGNEGRHVGGKIRLLLTGYVLFCQELLAFKGTSHSHALQNVDLGHPMISLNVSLGQLCLSKHVLSGLSLDWSVSLCPTLQIDPISLIQFLKLSFFLKSAHVDQYLMLVDQILQIGGQAHLHTLSQVQHIFYKTRER